jgi:serine/threonine protein kinase
MNLLGNVDHPNIVKLIGYCADDDERGVQRLLVYEYMPNGSVDIHLASRSSSTLSWPMRLKVALDVARGLKYLHEEMDFQVIHLRSGNQLKVIRLCDTTCIQQKRNTSNREVTLYLTI